MSSSSSYANTNAVKPKSGSVVAVGKMGKAGEGKANANSWTELPADAATLRAAHFSDEDQGELNNFYKFTNRLIGQIDQNLKSPFLSSLKAAEANGQWIQNPPVAVYTQQPPPTPQPQPQPQQRAADELSAVSYTHLTLPTTPYV